MSLDTRFGRGKGAAKGIRQWKPVLTKAAEERKAAGEAKAKAAAETKAAEERKAAGKAKAKAAAEAKAAEKLKVVGGGQGQGCST